VRSDARNRGAGLAKSIISEVDMALLVRGAKGSLLRRQPRRRRLSTTGYRPRPTALSPYFAETGLQGWINRN
jgi:hypothetical protein